MAHTDETAASGRARGEVAAAREVAAPFPHPMLRASNSLTVRRRDARSYAHALERLCASAARCSPLLLSLSLRLSEFEQLCVNNLSTQNDVRQQAEQTLVGLRASAPGTFMQALLAVLANSAQPLAREFSAVILRQNLLVNSQSPVWSQCSPDVQKQIQAGLLHLFTSERLPGLRNKITDAVAATATRIAGINIQHYGLLARGLADRQGAAKAPEPVPESQQAKWDELMPTVMQLAQVDAPEMRGSLLDLIDKVRQRRASIVHRTRVGVNSLLTWTVACFFFLSSLMVPSLSSSSH